MVQCEQHPVKYSWCIIGYLCEVLEDASLGKWHCAFGVLPYSFPEADAALLGRACGRQRGAAAINGIIIN